MSRWPLFVLALCACSEPVLAQSQPPATPRPTLDTALAQSAPPEGTVWLAVGAEKTPLPGGSEVPHSPASALQIANAFGRLLRSFGPVTAFAPPTMVVLNAEPVNPNPYDGLPDDEALKLLAASLTDSQWRALTGDQGLGADDLSTGTQRQLLAALLPHTLRVVRHVSSGPPPAGPGQDLTASLAQVRLRLRRETEILRRRPGAPTPWCSPTCLPHPARLTTI